MTGSTEWWAGRGGFCLLALFTPIAEERLLRILRGERPHRIPPAIFFQWNAAPAAADETYVAEIPSAVGFYRTDFCRIVRTDRALPLQPELPAVGHDVGQFDIDDARPLPVLSPPGR